jgi:hypothetical protein
MPAEANRAIARRDFEERWNRGNVAVADAMIAAHVNHDPAIPERGYGPESWKHLVTLERTASLACDLVLLPRQQERYDRGHPCIALFGEEQWSVSNT